MAFKYLVMSVLVMSSGSAFADEFSCVGMEPRWALDVAKDKMSLQVPLDEGQNDEFKAVEPRLGSGTTLIVFETKSAKSGKAATLVLTSGLAACSDGSSDIEYKYTATFILPNVVFNGCCNPK